MAKVSHLSVQGSITGHLNCITYYVPLTHPAKTKGALQLVELGLTMMLHRSWGATTASWVRYWLISCLTIYWVPMRAPAYVGKQHAYKRRENTPALMGSTCTSEKRTTTLQAHARTRVINGSVPVQVHGGPRTVKKKV